MNAETSAPRMWCDDFDTDLPKVVPDARRALGEIGDLELLTYGHTTHGRLNHPTVWNHELGMISFFWRPGHAFKPAHYYVGNDAPISCTLWEAIRDAWVHDNVIVFEGRPVFDGGASYPHFQALMYDVRGWTKLDERARLNHQVSVLDLIVRCDEAVRSVLERNP
jgi:hypothetical protein